MKKFDWKTFPVWKKTVCILAAICVIALIIWAFASGTGSAAGQPAGSGTGENTADETQTDQDKEEQPGDDAKDDEESENSTAMEVVTIAPPIYNEYVSNETESSTAAKSISLPYNIPDTTLKITNFQPYSGLYIEDGSDRTINGVACLFIENTGDQGYELAQIHVETADGGYNFTASAIPAHSVTAVQDAEAKAFKNAAITDITAAASQPETFAYADNLEVEGLDGGGIRIKNTGSETIPSARIFYKYYFDNMSTYVGGITYSAEIQDLKPNEERTIYSRHYDPAAGRILFTRVYESKGNE